MMTLAQFKASTSGGLKAKRSNLLIQQMDALLALYEGLDSTMRLEDRRDITRKIMDVANRFVDKKRHVPSKKTAGVKALADMARREWTRHCAELDRLAAERKQKAQQPHLYYDQAPQQPHVYNDQAGAPPRPVWQQSARPNMQQRRYNDGLDALLLNRQPRAGFKTQQQQPAAPPAPPHQAADQARANWATAMAKVNALLGPEEYRSVRTKILDPYAWPEFFDPQHRPIHALQGAVTQWQQANSASPFEVWLEKSFVPKHQNDPALAQRVTYLSPEEREEYRVDIVGGVFRWAESGDLVHTGGMTTHFSGRGHAIWVCSVERHFYCASHVVGSFQHSSFLGGLPVMGAGEWAVDQGRLVVISNKTGHYRAGFEEMFRVMLRLSANGVDLSSVKVFWPWPSNEGRKYYPAVEFMRARSPERFREPLDQRGKPLLAVPAPVVPQVA
ncbi:hypothetical protein [Reyranella sp. CPCC 100927]|uniref:hypothetical protein n=1 Tax=Reyranella sp. CPCC 100927 TaxID=2599616 RepID=UPI0011B6F127|nr:hypothetical protein [Reyranella sp. CPCC 100927]TWT00297.1 hypothetical protein FQU96_33775 [Reyranella sp. CPCC 100927]